MKSLKSRAFNLLRSSEHIFKLDLVYLAKGSLWTTLSFAVGTIASIVTMIAYGNLLSRESYGTYIYLMSLGTSLSFLTLSGTGTGVLRAVARGRENIIPEALQLQLKYNLIAIATVLSAATYYWYKGNSLFAGSLTLLAIAYPLAEAFHIYVQIFMGRKRFDILTKLASITTLIGTISIVITLLFTDKIIILITVYTVISILPNIIIYLYATKNIDKTVPSQKEIGELRRTAFHITGAGLIGTAAQYIDKIIIFQVAGPSTLALYGFAIAGPERLKSLLKNWMGIALPRLAETSLQQIRAVIYKRIFLSLLLGLVLCLSYITISPILFKMFLPKYLDAITYTQTLSLGLIVAPAFIYIGGIFSSQNMLRGTYMLSVGTQIIRITLFIILGWLWQIWGLIFAYLISILFNAIYSIVIWEMETRRLLRVIK